MGILGSIIGAVAGPLVNGLFGDKKQETTQRINYSQMRDDALKAGFNPLTVLKATGGTGNVTTTTPSLSSRSFLADAFTAGLDTYLNREQIEMDKQVKGLEIERYKAEIDDLKSRNTPPKSGSGFGYTIPLYDATSVAASGRLATKSLPAMAKPPSQPTASPFGGDYLINGTDGLVRANPNDPPEFETDFYGAARQGKLPSLVDGIVSRNIPELNKTINDGLFTGLKNPFRIIPNSPLDKARNWVKKPGRFTPPKVKRKWPDRAKTP